MTDRLSRREILKRAAVVGAVAAVAEPVFAQTSATDADPYLHLTTAEAATLEALVARLIPSDENGPGAAEAGAARYIDRALGDALANSRDFYAAGLAAVSAYAQRSAGKSFVELQPSEQDAVLGAMEQNTATGFTPNSVAFFELVLGHTLEGTFSDPHYGGNRDFVGWELIAYPGIRLAVAPMDQRMDATLQLTRLSAYDMPMFDADSATRDDR